MSTSKVIVSMLMVLVHFLSSLQPRPVLRPVEPSSFIMLHEIGGGWYIMKPHLFEWKYGISKWLKTLEIELQWG